MQGSAVLMAALLAPVAAFAETHEGHAAAGPAMPQLNTAYYPGQIFWLLVTGVLMYLIMSKLALPRVARMVQSREDRVRSDLEKAHRLRSEAEDTQAVYMRSLRDADENARFMLDRIVNEARAKQAKALEETNTRLAKKIAETDSFLKGEKEVLLKEAPNMGARLSQSMLGALGKKVA